MVFVLYIFCGFILGYLLLYWLVPGGYLLHELVRLPPYLLKMKQVPVREMKVEKFSFGNHWRQYFLFCHPQPNQPIKKNIIIYYHGGGWIFGSPEQFKANAKFFTDQGYHVIIPSYRRVPLYGFTKIRADLNSALLKIMEVIQEKKLSNKKFILGGMSGGGNLVAQILYNTDELHQLNLSSSSFSGIFVQGAPLNLKAMSKSLVLYFFAGQRTSSTFKKASPFELISNLSSTPIIIFHGTKDGMVNYNSAKTFADRLGDYQKTNIEFHSYKDGSHLDVGRWPFKKDKTEILLKKWLSEVEVNS